ncbi:DMT family transporter [Mucilaginibacter sp. UR6-1]|uniref:DMT family transporter n=1 Tax=Mucilaginibacter sp. UR6-1 TaxID=1435643 RepID=UPI001E5AF035|nr:DMT family transporter [Mucilaginibacter sp. UR6-1]MCC8411127.1 DMT family transporter [Mucilaginibacter sp. UR6-1]
MNPKASLALGIIFISFSPIFVKLAAEPAITAAFYRIFMAWIFLLPYCIFKGLLKIGRKDLLITIICGIIFAADIAVWNISILKISATVSTLLANLAPVWVGLISFFILRKQTGKLFWAGTIIAIAGMVVLVGYRNIIELHINQGVMLAVLASFFYSLYIVTSKGVLQRVNTLTFMFYNMLASMIFLLVLGLGGGYNLTRFPTATWLYFLATGLICQLAGWITINYAIKFLPPTKVSITLLSQTVVTGLLAAVMLHEKLGVTEIIGSLIVLGGIAITFLKPSQSKIS